MGLFRKKPQKTAPARPAKQPKPGKQPKATKPPKPPKPGKPPKPPKAQKGLVRGVVDPADFIALRFEMVDLRARLEASEQSKAIVETRLAVLDAGNAMARPPHSGGGVDGEVRHRIAEFEAQLGAVAAAAAAATATAESAAAKAADAAATATAVANTPAPAPPPLVAPVGPPTPDPELVARLDALTAMVDAQHAARVDPNRLTELEQRISTAANAAADTTRLSEIETLIAELTTKAAEPAPSVDNIVSITGQLAQLNARVTAQAEVGAQLSSLRDRIGELSSGSTTLPPPVPAVDDGLIANVQALTYRVEVLSERMESSETRARQTSEQLAAIEHRMNAVSTELTNQLSELGRDIDVFGSSNAANGSGDGQANGSNGAGSNGNGHGSVGAELVAELQNAQIKLAADQVRYEIAFRQDLATLAEHVRRAKP